MVDCLHGLAVLLEQAETAELSSKILPGIILDLSSSVYFSNELDG